MKDADGNELVIGDRVTFGQYGTHSENAAQEGWVLGFSPQQVRILAERSRWRKGRRVAGFESICKIPGFVTKAWRQDPLPDRMHEKFLEVIKFRVGDMPSGSFWFHSNLTPLANELISIALRESV